MTGRVLGVDWGERRIGLALSDESGTLASPLATLTRRTGKRPPVADILRTCQSHDVRAVVVGLPLDESGQEGPAAVAARELADALTRRGAPAVTLWDERMSTARALQAVREAGGSTRGRKDDLDALAAAVLLQTYLDARRGGAT